MESCDPRSMSWLVMLGTIVRVGPPLLASGPRDKLVPKARLLPPVSTNPLLLPTALKLTLTVVAGLVRRISGALTLMLPDTTELSTLIEPALLVIRARPPPPMPAV